MALRPVERRRDVGPLGRVAHLGEPRQRRPGLALGEQVAGIEPGAARRGDTAQDPRADLPPVAGPGAVEDHPLRRHVLREEANRAPHPPHRPIACQGEKARRHRVAEQEQPQPPGPAGREAGEARGRIVGRRDRVGLAAGPALPERHRQDAERGLVPEERGAPGPGGVHRAFEKEPPHLLVGAPLREFERLVHAVGQRPAQPRGERKVVVQEDGAQGEPRRLSAPARPAPDTAVPAPARMSRRVLRMVPLPAPSKAQAGLSGNRCASPRALIASS